MIYLNKSNIESEVISIASSLSLSILDFNLRLTSQSTQTEYTIDLTNNQSTNKNRYDKWILKLEDYENIPEGEYNADVISQEVVYDSMICRVFSNQKSIGYLNSNNTIGYLE